MLIIIDKHSGVPIYRQILDQVKHQILTRQLKEGEQLTSVKDLSEELKVNPMTISKAYSLLEHEQFVERRRGIGLFATKPKQELTQKTKLGIVEEALTRVVVQAIHLGLTEEEITAVLSSRFRELNSPKE